ncbi:MAG TPA: carbamoyltransferase HypF, partial [Vicinamibacteria bacterium]|nr:carbamoyltransferase HypF [Vicinamibacteria bacterium]
NEDARRRLRGLADVLLLHDREIVARADDSVTRPTARARVVLRRSRGLAPEPFTLGFHGPHVLAVGADLKNAPAVARDGRVFVAPHVGDLDNADAQQAWGEVRARLESLFGVRPVAAAHDLHPGYHGTAIARGLGLTAVAVQHHHAHVASCMVENGWRQRVIGVTWDGMGYGADETAWGGEFLVADFEDFTRVGRLRPVPLPGGDAAREGWRLALVHLREAGVEPPRAWSPSAAGTRKEALTRMIERGAATVPTSSVGRLFDAVASLAGVRHVSAYEGQAAMELEGRASEGAEPYPLPVVDLPASSPVALELDPRRLVRAVTEDAARGADASRIASRFHAALVSAIAEACARIREKTGVETVALTGGCFANRILLDGATRALEDERFRVLRHAEVPPGDGGLAVGQAAVASWRLKDTAGEPG